MKFIIFVVMLCLSSYSYLHATWELHEDSEITSVQGQPITNLYHSGGGFSFFQRTNANSVGVAKAEVEVGGGNQNGEPSILVEDFPHLNAKFSIEIFSSSLKSIPDLFLVENSHSFSLDFGAHLILDQVGQGSNTGIATVSATNVFFADIATIANPFGSVSCSSWASFSLIYDGKATDTLNVASDPSKLIDFGTVQHVQEMSVEIPYFETFDLDS